MNLTGSVNDCSVCSVRWGYHRARVPFLLHEDANDDDDDDKEENAKERTTHCDTDDTVDKRNTNCIKCMKTLLFL